MQARNLEIDRLRAFAILMTVMVHSGAITQGRAPGYERMLAIFDGSAGVILFLCISGYVISRSFIPSFEASDDKISEILSFWFRRLTRITPMALLWITIPLLLCGFFNESGAFGKLSANIPAAIASALNVYNVYAKWAPREDTYAIYWSLSLEEQFYILFPILLFAVANKWARMAIIVVACSLVFYVPDRLHGAFTPNGLAFGAILFMLAGKPKNSGNVSIMTGCLVSLALVLAAMLLTPLARHHLVEWQYRLVAPTISIVLVYLATLERGFILPIRFLAAPLDWIGTRSFGIYLIHFPVFFLVTELTFFRPAINTIAIRGALALVLIVVATEASYRYFETPIRNWGRSRAKRFARENGVILGEDLSPDTHSFAASVKKSSIC
jgi:peptidoglycan/LPS O-acetylase OafA/YrhL